MHDLLSSNFQVPETSARFQNSQNNSNWSDSSLLQLRRTEIVISLIRYPYCPREYCTFPIFNLPCTPKPMQNWEEWINWNYFFFLQNFLSPVDSGRKTLKYWLSSGGVVSPNQRCRQRNKYLQRLSEDKDFFSKFVLVTRQRERWGKKLCSVMQFHLQRHLTTVYNILS